MTIDEWEMAQKMERIRSLSEAIQRTKEDLAVHKNANLALSLQRLQQERDELQRTLPKLRIVT